MCKCPCPSSKTADDPAMFFMWLAMIFIMALIKTCIDNPSTTIANKASAHKKNDDDNEDDDWDLYSDNDDDCKCPCD
jgi:hypothetical protein